MKSGEKSGEFGAEERGCIVRRQRAHRYDDIYGERAMRGNLGEERPLHPVAEHRGSGDVRGHDDGEAPTRILGGRIGDVQVRSPKRAARPSEEVRRM